MFVNTHVTLNGISGNRITNPLDPGANFQPRGLEIAIPTRPTVTPYFSARVSIAAVWVLSQNTFRDTCFILQFPRELSRGGGGGLYANAMARAPPFASTKSSLSEFGAGEVGVKFSHLKSLLIKKCSLVPRIEGGKVHLVVPKYMCLLRPMTTTATERSLSYDREPNPSPSHSKAPRCCTTLFRKHLSIRMVGDLALALDRGRGLGVLVHFAGRSGHAHEIQTHSRPTARVYFSLIYSFK
ncbi:hypothetical protein EVAR_95923_1 [Eumeta japonica]|uniref:Uncharacterized protein n=1 Tax=Eumeta variegata TaxID=151549 RepID=A0A4C1XHT6_EUMVA|nr:hypothetical protein EVAR_95923_1 [Eumeta japonica]